MRDVYLALPGKLDGTPVIVAIWVVKLPSKNGDVPEAAMNGDLKATLVIASFY